MNKNNLLTKILLLGLVVLLFACNQEIVKPIPEKHPDLSQGKYDKYIGLLKEAYSTNNNFDASFQLANLKADKSATYQLLNLSVKEEPNRCDKIYYWYWLYDKNNFGVNILKYDTVEFKKTIRICDEINKPDTYLEYAKGKDESTRQAVEKKRAVDSTKFNMKLVKELEQINDDDQAIRIKITAKNITPELKKELRNEMKIIDSINLVKIDKIFKEYGYPSKELVGADANFTPAIIIHHSSNLETRNKYLPFLEKAVEDGLLNEGALNMIKQRMEDMQLGQK